MHGDEEDWLPLVVITLLSGEYMSRNESDIVRDLEDAVDETLRELRNPVLVS